MWRVVNSGASSVAASSNRELIIHGPFVPCMITEFGGGAKLPKAAHFVINKAKTMALSVLQSVLIDPYVHSRPMQEFFSSVAPSNSTSR